MSEKEKAVEETTEQKPTEQKPTNKPDMSQVIKTPSKKTIKDAVPDSEAIAQEIADNTILNEIAQGYRIIEESRWGPLRIYKDSKMFVAVTGDNAYTRERFLLLKDPTVPSLVELTELLQGRGIWTEEQDDAIKEVSTDIETLNAKIEKVKKETEKKGLEDQREKKLDAFWNLLAIREQVFGESIETKAEVARRSAMMIEAVRKNIADEPDHNKLQRVWNTSDDLMNEDSEDFTWILRECQNYWSNQGTGGDVPLEK